MSTKNTDRNTAKIGNQPIVWWLRGDNAPTELDDASIEHLTTLIKEGNREGELHVHDGDVSYRGWWELDLSGDDEVGVRTLSDEEAIADILDVLRESGGNLVAQIYNQVCNGTIAYKGDSTFELTPDSE